MNFQQLRIVRETVQRNFNLTEVANALYTSQSGVSKHIRDLEEELGVELYVRKGKRLLGLTEPGKAVIKIVDRMLQDAGNIRNLARNYSQTDSGELTIATTHTQARYVLPTVITRFKKLYPRVHLKLLQAGPREIADLLLARQADIGIATESLGGIAELEARPWYHWRHDVIVPAEHPLTKAGPLTLEAIGRHPIITYHEGFTGRSRVERAFADAGVDPDIVLSALDADVIKSYVELGLGIGIIHSMAFDPARDTRLRKLDGGHLFEENTTLIAVRRGHLLRSYGHEFVQLCASGDSNSTGSAILQLADAS